MKIIGLTDRGAIVALEDEEVANLAGFCTAHSMEREKGHKPKVGEYIPVSAMYKNATETLAAYTEIKKSLGNVQNQTARLLALMLPKEVAKP